MLRFIVRNKVVIFYSFLNGTFRQYCHENTLTHTFSNEIVTFVEKIPPYSCTFFKAEQKKKG